MCAAALSAAVLAGDTVLAALGRVDTGTRFEYVCSAGFVITSINGRYGDWVEGLGPFLCGSSSTTSSFPIVGSGTTGTGWDHIADAGYAGISTSYDWASLNALTLMPAKDSNVSYGTMDGDAGQLRCPAGTVIAGVFGSADPGRPYIYSLGDVCRKGERGRKHSSAASSQ